MSPWSVGHWVHLSGVLCRRDNSFRGMSQVGLRANSINSVRWLAANRIQMNLVECSLKSIKGRVMRESCRGEPDKRNWLTQQSIANVSPRLWINLSLIANVVQLIPTSTPLSHWTQRPPPPRNYSGQPIIYPNPYPDPLKLPSGINFGSRYHFNFPA